MADVGETRDKNGISFSQAGCKTAIKRRQSVDKKGCFRCTAYIEVGMPHLIDKAGLNPVKLVLLCLVFTCSWTKVFAQGELVMDKGILDLTGKDLSGNSFLIEGEVEFYWLSLLQPDDFQNLSEPVSYFREFPDTWNKKVVDGDSLTANGYASYRFRIVLPPDAVGAELGFYVQDMYSAYKLFVDEREVATNGIVAARKEDYTPYWLPQATTFIASSDTLSVVLQIANFDHSNGGIKDALVFGDAAVIKKKFSNDLAYDYILAGSLFMGGLFFLGLYMLGRDKKSILYFALFCLAFAYRAIGSVDYGLHHMMPGLSWHWSIHMEYFGLYLIAFFFVRYTLFLYPEETSGKVMNVFSLIMLLLMGTVIFLPVSTFTSLPPVFTSGIALFLPYCLFIYIKGIRNKRPGAVFALLSIAIMFVSYGLYALDYFQVTGRQNLLFFIGLMSFFFLQSLISSYRFAMAYKMAIKDAQQALEAKSEFLSVMSHEIRTPLNAVVGMSNLLEESCAEGQQENIKTLKNSAQNLLLLVNNILDYSKIEAGRIEFERIDTDLNEVVEKLRLVHRGQVLEDGLSLLIEIDPEIPKRLICDPTRLTQILSNLLSNAIKFTHRGFVKVELALVNLGETEATVRFTVEDSGIGIAPEKQNLVFDTFTQASTSISRNYGGTGLGLAIIRRLLDLQGCRLWLKSNEGEGSAFWFEQTFEIARNTRQQTARSVDYSEWKLLTGKRVLLVEDNPVNVVVAKKFMERWQVILDVVVSGTDALDMPDDYDLILMDLQLPDMDGYEVSRILRNRNVQTPILAFTASALMDAKDKILASGMDDYVMKPFDPEDLYRKMVSQLPLSAEA